ncbi:MAG: universal stress protein [Thermoleophilia bacterium]|nr:universal stress protein [Thermoleophilia bacterium]
MCPPSGTVHSITVLDSRGASRAGLEYPRQLALLVDDAESTREQAAALLEGHPSCDARVIPGDPLETLLAHATDEHTTLIAAGSHRHSRTVGMLLGSTSTGLLHNAPCSVLVARINWGHSESLNASSSALTEPPTRSQYSQPQTSSPPASGPR